MPIGAPMHKANSLRGFIAQFFPQLATDPQRLRMWVETGQIRATDTAHRHFEWEYKLKVMIEEFAGDASGLVVVINEWCRRYQPDVLRLDTGYPFQADILDDGTYDVLFTLPLSDPVRVTDRIGGGWNCEARDDPTPFFEEDIIGGNLREIWRGGARIVPLPDA